MKTTVISLRAGNYEQQDFCIPNLPLTVHHYFSHSLPLVSLLLRFTVEYTITGKGNAGWRAVVLQFFFDCVSSVCLCMMKKKKNGTTHCKNFPFMEMPWEVRVKTLSKLSAGDLKSVRLVCRAANDLVDKHRASIGPMRIKRLLFGQPWRLRGGPERFVAWNCASFVKCLKSCSHAEVTYVVMHSITLGPRAIRHIIEGLRRNHVRISGLIISRVTFNCNVELFVELLKAAEVSNLAIIARKLPLGFKESLLEHDFMRTANAYFIALFNSFETRDRVAELYADPPYTLKGAETFFKRLWRFNGKPVMHACFPILCERYHIELPGMCRLRSDDEGNVYVEFAHRISIRRVIRHGPPRCGEDVSKRRLLIASVD
ncbi:hypothetical protein Y032_0022g582 [Ancylostoma ceylanicum]|uniref:F-box domain-containing protein n=2 Tax=Ancylostoma ceylanicum TaxID=53326 RepID=A0A016V0S4_9BILA|nr:hypothetical protein Y032_0022g582 [Ancylostoma ceylanicum]